MVMGAPIRTKVADGAIVVMYRDSMSSSSLSIDQGDITVTYHVTGPEYKWFERPFIDKWIVWYYSFITAITIPFLLPVFLILAVLLPLLVVGVLAVAILIVVIVLYILLFVVSSPFVAVGGVISIVLAVFCFGVCCCCIIPCRKRRVAALKVKLERERIERLKPKPRVINHVEVQKT